MGSLEQIDIETQKDIETVAAFARDNGYSNLYKSLPDISPDFNTWFERIIPFDRKRLYSCKDQLSHFEDGEVRFLSSEFNPARFEELFLIPQLIDTMWQSVSSLCRSVQPKVASLIVPPFWQMGPMFYHTCRKEKVPVSVMTPRNLPIARQLIKEAEVDMVVTTASASRELHTLLLEEGLERQIRTWHIVLTEDGNIEHIPIKEGISLEYFIFPGISFGKADAELFSTGVLAVQPSDDFFVELADGNCLVTCRKKTALPLIRFQIGGTWRIESEKENAFFVRTDYGK